MDYIMETSFSAYFYAKQINAKKYEWKFGSVQIVIARQYITLKLFCCLFASITQVE